MRTNRFNTGKPFEREIERIAMQYSSKGLLRLRKVDPPARYIGGKVIHMANPFLDWVGAWTEQSGRAVFVEAKSTRDPNLPVGTHGLTTAQMTAMHCWHAAGAVAFLLWECRGEVRLWTEPSIAEQSRKWRHLKFANGQPVPRGMGWVTHDFLAVMRQVWG